MVEKMVNDGYVLHFPGNRITLGVGRVNLIGKNFRLDLSKPNMGLPTTFRLIAKKNWYSFYSVDVPRAVLLKIQNNIHSGNNYRIFNVD